MHDETTAPDAPLRFLIVDDDPDIRFLLRSLLSQFAACDEAGSGNEALAMVREAIVQGRGYRLVMLDLMMPGQDGLSTLRDIRALEAELGVPGGETLTAIMVTAVDDPEVIWGAHFEGLAAGYLVKPVKRDVLLRRLREMGIISPGS